MKCRPNQRSTYIASRAAPMSESWSRVGFVLLAATAATVASCSDASRVMTSVSSRSAGKASASVAVGAGAPASTVSFDVAIQNSTSKSANQTLYWHIDRTRGTGGGWRTTVTIPDDPRMARMHRAPWRPKQFLVDETGHLTIYRADGQVATLPDLASAPLAPILAKAELPRPESSGSQSPTLHVEWLDGIVMTSSGRAQETATAVQGSSAPTRDGSGLDHYAKSVGAKHIDFGIDPSAGVIASLNVSSPSGSHQVAHAYALTSTGNSVRWRTQIEDSGPTRSRSMTIVLSNITVDGHEVQP